MILLILQLALVGFILWLILTYIPMPELFKNVIIVLVAIIMILYVMRVFGVGLLNLPKF